MVYQKKCASCHGKAGEGTKAYAHPLIGNRSLEQLARYIAKKMPEDAPGTCTGVEAEKVAAFIFDAFYSPAAQARIKAPRVELARLTVNEYRNAVTDLVGSIRPGRGGLVAKEQGLRGEYFTRDGKRNRSRAFDRLDPTVNFDFAAKTPDFEKLASPEINAEWQGSVIAPETGMFDFIVKTEHSTRLWVNDMKKPLIDASIKSGNDTVFRGSIFLLAGRAYPLRLEFSRGNVGVRKDPAGKLATVKTTIALEWKPPSRAADVIPPMNLRPSDAPTSFALTIAVPPDDQSAGYERGTAVSKAWVQATTDGAIETAGYVAANLNDLSGIKPGDPQRKERLQKYGATFVERAFRRPLSPEEKRLYVDRQFEASKDDETAIKRVVLLALQSPRFLYREPATGKDDAFSVASRISFGLWDSLPDQTLLDAAASGKLTTRDDVVREATRMLNDPRARAKLHRILLQWLKIDQIAELPKDKKIFPTFDAATVADLQMSVDLALDDALWSNDSDFRQFLRGGDLFVNGRLAALYGFDLPADAPFQKVSTKPGERSGVITHPFILANFSYTATSSPIHRGVFLARNILGVGLRQPPDAFTPLPAELHPKLNTRERITLQTSSKDCQSCHAVINPLGFTLERFDAIGRLRDSENGKPIDATGMFMTRSGETQKFAGADDLGKFLAASDEVQEAFVARMFHAIVKQPILAYGPNKLDELRRRFADNNCDMRRLVIDIIADAALPPARRVP